MNFKNQIFAGALCLLLAPSWAMGQDRVVVVKISGAINPVVSEFVKAEIQEANEAGDALVVLTMDTPGGLDTAMRVIIKAIQSSKIPVATFVSPSGSRAASAGTFITIASHIAAMAPGTNIGAAHPVNLMGGGEEGGDKKPSHMEEKIVNDASAYIRSLAEMRGRNATWAEMSVRQSKSISAIEAKRLGVIDLVANDINALLLVLHERKVQMEPGAEITLIKTQGKLVVFREMSKREKILDIISNPNVAYILMMIGMVGLYFELSNPGLILPGVLGGICLVLALYSMQTLPINIAGLLLIVLGIIFFIAEINVMSYGLLAVGGAIAIFLGSLMLIDSDDPAMQISRGVIYPTLLISILIAGGTTYFAVRSARLKSITGQEGLIGSTGVVSDELNPKGSVFVHGETWNAECGANIPVGETVVIEAVDGLNLKVKKVSEVKPV